MAKPPRKRKADASFDVPAAPAAGKPTGWVYRSDAPADAKRVVPAAAPAPPAKAEPSAKPLPAAKTEPAAKAQPPAKAAPPAKPAAPAPAPERAPLIATPPIVAAARATPPVRVPEVVAPPPAAPARPVPDEPRPGALMKALDIAVTPLVVGLLFVLAPFGSSAPRRPSADRDAV